MRYAIKEFKKSKSIKNAVSVLVVMSTFSATVAVTEIYLMLNGVK